ncbi:MAG TPA: hypothetical protein VM488_19255 [Pseudobacter sp.]|nr:hypothetical protein [Pseudobacter sp.]
MENLSLYKGIHPGLVLDRELKSRNLKESSLAIELGECPQTLSEIIRGGIPIPPGLALKIEEALGWEVGFLSTLQLYYDINHEIKKQSASEHPDFSLLRPALFWDTKMDKIDWTAQKRAVIERVFSRGTEQEKNLIREFYGKETVDRILQETEFRLQRKIIPESI